MSVLTTVVETEVYLAQMGRMMTEQQRSLVVDTVARDPLGGVVIKGMGGLRKMRIALSGRGKRGGGRVIYWYHSPGYPAVLIWAFAKNEASDLTDVQRRRLATLADRLLVDFGAKR